MGRHTRGPTYPDIDIGASQTDSALMRGAAAGEGPARPRRCRCPRVKRVRLSTSGATASSTSGATASRSKISRPQGGVKRLLFGCERPKNECFTCPTMGHGTRLGVFSSRRWGLGSKFFDIGVWRRKCRLISNQHYNRTQHTSPNNMPIQLVPRILCLSSSATHCQ